MSTELIRIRMRAPRARGSRRVLYSMIPGLARLADAAVVCGTGIAGYVIRFGVERPPDWALYSLVLAALLTLNVFQAYRLYDSDALLIRPVPLLIRRLLPAWTMVALILLALGFASKAVEVASRLWVGLWFVHGFVGLLLVRLALRLEARRLRRGRQLVRLVAVAGAGEHGRRLVEHLRRVGAGTGTEVVGLFDDRRSRTPAVVAGCPVLGTIDDLLVFGRTSPLDEIIVALPHDAEARILEWLKKLKNLPVDVRLGPGLIGFRLPHHGVTQLASVPLVNVFERPLSGWAYAVKTVEDWVLGAAALVLFAPLMLLIALAIRLDSEGPALYRQKRYGFNNQVIRVYKFRTMHVAACDDGAGGRVEQARRDDPRVTRVGRWLRRTSLDELPQLLNVLEGTMSVVGPRPHAVSHNEHYAPLIDEYLARHRVKPGITGWAQVNGLRGETDTLNKMQERVKYDLYYIENWSLLFDLSIIIRTAVMGFVHRSAY